MSCSLTRSQACCVFAAHSIKQGAERHCLACLYLYVDDFLSLHVLEPKGSQGHASLAASVIGCVRVDLALSKFGGFTKTFQIDVLQLPTT
mmetsp:Transcript_7654/g.20385  ORF Transcript_7654/g.20385 Transcript_7654/m.20385 type:complete len:90 (-) Transcript_7654:548-817(-)